MTQRRADGPHRVVRLALLTAIALTIFMAEAQLPPLVPIQGVKLGLANIVTVYAVFVLGPGDALMILSARIFLGAVFSGQMMTLLYSAGGGLLAWAVMAVLSRFLTVKQLWLASPVAAVFHNLGQLLVAAGVMKSWTVMAFLPWLLISGVIGGLFTGLCAQFLIGRLDIISRPQDSASGASLHLEGGVPETVSPVGAPAGTTIIVRDLFFNTPARMKFMTKDSSEASCL